jgi:quercetin dioxygenase-like cupin family protein
MNQIDLLSQRYPKVSIGFSTHEDPDNFDAVKVAVAKGCRIFERHVGLVDKGYSINGYSSTPSQIGDWVASAKNAFDICGGPSRDRMMFSEKEVCDLNDLYRGVYAKKDIKAGDVIDPINTYYAMPIQDGQLPSRSLSKYAVFTASKDIKINEAVMYKTVRYTNRQNEVNTILKEMSAMLKKANIAVPDNIPMAISAHYGMDRFHEFGTILIDVLNREYCKKSLVVMPGQNHPTHLHKIKEETFHILDGQLEVDFGSAKHSLSRGDLLTVPRGQKHSFRSDEGAIIEEVSTTHIGSDSYYDDETINNNPHRKFSLTYYSGFADLEEIK